MRHERVDKFFLRFFYFFLESISQIRQSEQKLGRMLFSQVIFCCGMTPYLSETTFSRTYIARIGSNDIGLILTRISASFGDATRDVSQNGN